MPYALCPMANESTYETKRLKVTAKSAKSTGERATPHLL